MAEDLTDYLDKIGILVRYIHSDVDSLESVEILRDLRLGEFDVLVGVNLLREGLDLPEVSLVAIIDADKEGFLRSERSLMQTAGRTARNVNGKVIMYADRITNSMQKTIRRNRKKKNYTNKVQRRTRNHTTDDLQKHGRNNEFHIHRRCKAKRKRRRNHLHFQKLRSLF